MRDYGKVSPKFWTGKTGKLIKARGSEAVIVAMYLMSSPHSNMLGLYYQPTLYMAHETGLGIEGASKGLHDCIEAGFCAFDEASEMVWVYEMAIYQIANELKATDKRCAGIQKDYDALPDCPFLGDFFDRYTSVFHLKSRRENEGAYQAPSKPLPSQEQEQEQEQDISTEQKPLALVPEIPPKPEPDPIAELPLNTGPDHRVMPDDVAAWAQAFPAVDIPAELKRMSVWLTANPRKRKTARGINAFIVSWLTRQQDKPRQQSQGGATDQYGVPL